MNEIGEILKAARIEKGYTLDDLQQITKIQKRYLQAIENGNTEILPGRFYTRAFVKQYADIVGLDGEELLEENLGESAQDASEEFAENVTVPHSRTRGKQSSFLDNIGEYLPTLLIFLIVAIIVSVIYIAWRQVNDGNDDQQMINENNTEQVAPPASESNEDAEETPADDSNNNDEATNEESTNEEEMPEEADTPEAQEITMTETTGADTTFEVAGPHPEEQNIILTANGGSTWVSITVAGGASDAAMLNDGETLELSFGPDVTQVDLVIGNAPATDITLNDAEVQYAPESEGVVRQDIQLQFVE